MKTLLFAFIAFLSTNNSFALTCSEFRGGAYFSVRSEMNLDSSYVEKVIRKSVAAYYPNYRPSMTLAEIATLNHSKTLPKAIVTLDESTGNLYTRVRLDDVVAPAFSTNYFFKKGSLDFELVESADYASIDTDDGCREPGTASIIPIERTPTPNGQAEIYCELNDGTSMIRKISAKLPLENGVLFSPKISIEAEIDLSFPGLDTYFNHQSQQKFIVTFEPYLQSKNTIQLDEKNRINWSLSIENNAEAFVNATSEREDHGYWLENYHANNVGGCLVRGNHIGKIVFQKVVNY